MTKSQPRLPRLLNMCQSQIFWPSTLGSTEGAHLWDRDGECVRLAAVRHITSHFPIWSKLTEWTAFRLVTYLHTVVQCSDTITMHTRRAASHTGVLSGRVYWSNKETCVIQYNAITHANSPFNVNNSFRAQWQTYMYVNLIGYSGLD